jgi:2-polyprenyl-6-methoxyphenol hydroxylase-like FAD-dependent oxidoreductase
MPHAVIVGAGIAGLAAALRLGRDGWRTTVVERAPQRRSGGYLVNLLGPGYDAAEGLGLIPELASHDVGLFTTVLVHADGRPKLTVPSAVAEAALGARALTVFRGDLESTLYDAVADHTDFRFGTTVAAVDQDADEVRVVLSDGTTLHGDLLIGADGVRSGTRGTVFGAGGQVDLPYVVAAFPLPGPAAEHTATTYIGPGRTAATFGGKRAAAFFTYRCADPAAELRRGAADALTAAFGDLGGPVAKALEVLPAGVYFDAVSQVVLPRWSNGRVVLLGDAAWCVTLFAGHGAALALAGADRLGAALLDHPGDLGAALARWEAGLRPEVTGRQESARRGMAQYVPPTRFHVWMGELAIRAMTLPGVRGLVRRGIERANR